MTQRMIPDLDIWRAAAMLIKRHGADVAFVANSVWKWQYHSSSWLRDCHLRIASSTLLWGLACGGNG